MFGPPPNLTISEWADANRVLSSAASSSPGRWYTDRAPYQREMMDIITDDEYETVVIMTGSQVGKTEILLNAIGYFSEHSPAPMMAMQPTLEMAAAFSKDRVSSLYNLSPALNHLIRDTRSRNARAAGAGATVFHKKFPGGGLTMVGANSASSLASRPISKLFADEIDRYPASAGEEGDPLNLAKKRTATFHNRKIVLTSTPTVKGASRIEMAFEESDQRRYYVPCPHCETMQPLEWKNVSWAKDGKGKWDGSAPWYNCDACGAKIDESSKSAMLKMGQWVPQATSRGIAGFHLNELYSPWRTWGNVVTDFLEAKKDSQLLRVWTNTSLGETYEEDGESISPVNLQSRTETYNAQVPDGAVVLVAGVDVQDNRLEATVVGAGKNHERWAIGHYVIPGNPGLPTVWSQLDELLLTKEFTHESGRHLTISAAAVDSGGHHTKRVYEYCKQRRAKRIFAIKGVGGFGRPAVSASSRKRTGRDSGATELWTLGVDEIKSLIYSRLQLTEPGPGYIHFPNNDYFDEEYFAQLTAEKIMTKFRRGVPYREWVCTRARNEALDCMVYAHAAIVLLKPNYDALARRLAAEPIVDTEPKDKTQGRSRGAKRTPRRGGFVNSWK